MSNTSKVPTIIFEVEPGGVLQGEVRVPGDKSISHRAIMLGALSEGLTKITGFLEGEDSKATLKAFIDMGVNIERLTSGEIIINGVGLHGLKKPKESIYLGNSGTSMRLLMGILSGQKFDSVLSGDESLSKRPMERVAEPLRQMGAKITTSNNGTAPIQIFGNQKLRKTTYELPIASAQVKSSVLLAGLYCKGETRVIEPTVTRDHTERMLKGLQYEVEQKGKQISLSGGGSMTGTDIDIPGDISSAAFFIVGATIAKGSKLELKHIGLNPTRIGIINILSLMGADIIINNERIVGGEQVGDIVVTSAPLKGIEIPIDQVSLAIDEFPVISIAAACAQGTTILKGASELRVKESDRIQAMVTGLVTLGINATALEDGIVIEGGIIEGGTVNSEGDHRIAMAFSIASLCSTKRILVEDCSNVSTSFPDFVNLAEKVGLTINSRKDINITNNVCSDESI